MTVIQVPPSAAAIEATLAVGEEIACTNATVIVKDGVVTGWFDNGKPLQIIRKEEDNHV